MTWFLVAIWAFVAAPLLLIVNSRGMHREQLLWSAVLCALWPLLLAFFFFGTALWAVSSTYHAIKHRRW